MIESNEKEKIQSSDNSLLTIGEPKQYYVVMHMMIKLRSILLLTYLWRYLITTKAHRLI